MATEGATMDASEHLPPQFNVATWFVDRHVTEGRAGAPAFHYDNRVLTYGDVSDLVNRTGNALGALGVGPEDRVLLLCLDAPEFLGAFWGAIKIGAVPIPVNTLIGAADAGRGADVERRRRVLALLVGLHRISQGRRPPPSRHVGVRADVCQAGARHHGERQDLLGGQALLRLRPRRRR